jgi:hypothetical protein
VWRELRCRLAAIEALGVDPALSHRLRELAAEVGVARQLYTATSEAA